MLTPHSPAEQILTRPTALWQRGWLRWPLAWSLATLLTLGMLAALATASRPWQHIPPPERLAADLRPPVPPRIPSTQRPTSAARSNQKHSATETPVRTSEPPLPTPLLSREASDTPGLSAPQPGATSTANALPGNPAVPGSSTSLPVASSQTTVTSLPLKQRCKTQVKPEFPRRAQEDDIEQGHILARLHLDAQGQVTDVSILESRPAGYFEAATRKAAMQWQCLPSGQANDTVRVPFEFGVK